MATLVTGRRLRTFFDPRPARWWTLVVIAVVLAYADGFLLTALTGAVGAIQRTQDPAVAWLVQSAVLVPFFLLAELGVLAWVRHRHGVVFRSTKRMLTCALLLAVAGTIVGVVGVTASSAVDFQLQTSLVQAGSAFHDHGVAAPDDPNACTDVCEEIHETLTGDLRGIGFSGPALLVINIVLVGWILAAFGGRLGAAPKRAAGTSAGTSADASSDVSAVASAPASVRAATAAAPAVTAEGRPS
jgi:hypothetical protein